MIFYFSGTGNSFAVATQIKNEINEELVSIAGAIKNDKYNYELTAGERVGFVFPVFYYGLPSIVKDFLEKFSLTNYDKPFTYSVITCGGGIASAGRRFAQSCEKKGYSVQASYSIIMPDSSAILFRSPNKQKQEKQLANAEKELPKIISEIRERHPHPDSSGIFARLSSALLYPFYDMARKTTKFHADDKCTGCGVCQENCPCNAIEMTRDKKPKWVKTECTMCLGCLHRCPAEAIQRGNATIARSRYTNPILGTKNM